MGAGSAAGVEPGPPGIVRSALSPALSVHVHSPSWQPQASSVLKQGKRSHVDITSATSRVATQTSCEQPAREQSESV